jgi:antitoxin YefM
VAQLEATRRVLWRLGEKNPWLSDYGLLLLLLLICTVLQYETGFNTMDTISVNRFKDNLKNFIEQVVNQHEPIKVSRRAGEDFIVVGAEDWEREQETLYVLQNSGLMKQIASSITTHTKYQGYKPTKEEVDEITGI